MIPLKEALGSSLLKKLLTAVTGVALFAFTVLHLAENLLLYVPGGVAFNTYSATLNSYKLFVLVAEIGLATMFFLHIVNGIFLKINHAKARPHGYKTLGSKSGPVKSSTSSRTMIVSGLVLLVFLIVHVRQFRFGPEIHDGYKVEINGAPARDMFRIVTETFQNPFFVGFYMVAMLFLWGHLRHGIWSALQSLGLMNGRSHKTAYLLSWLIAVILAVGFLSLPLYVYFVINGGGGTRVL